MFSTAGSSRHFRQSSHFLAEALNHDSLRTTEKGIVQMKPVCRTDVQMREIGGEWVVLDRSNELIHQLNQSAGFVWKCCDGSTDAQEIAARMAEEYGISTDLALQDVLAVLKKFTELGLLKSGAE